MKMTDSHHMHRPIQRLIDYGRQVGCQYHWVTYNRQHVHFYRQAGLSNVFWMPGAMGVAPREVPPANSRDEVVLYCGNESAYYSYRAACINALKQSAVPFRATRLPYDQMLAAYARARIVFNCSLNGDLNRRVFECLMAGGFLLTDRLSAPAGLDQLFQEREHLELYDSPGELADKARFYLKHPEQADQIARAGQAAFWRICDPGKLYLRLYDFVTGAAPLPALFAVDDDVRGEGQQHLGIEQRVALYELLQELHRVNPVLRARWLNLRENWRACRDDLSDLPRLELLAGSPGDRPSPDPEPLLIAKSSDLAASSDEQSNDLKFLLHQSALVIVLNDRKQSANPVVKSRLHRHGFRLIRLREGSAASCDVYYHPARSGALNHGDTAPGLVETVKRRIRSFGRRILPWKRAA
jgi:hypothetical protein